MMTAGTAAPLTHQAWHELQVSTCGEGYIRLDSQLNSWIAATGIVTGVLHLTCLHTSASLTINENADPRVMADLSAWMQRVAPQIGVNPLGPRGDYHRYRHDDEGDDDMPAHIRTALTSQTLSLSVDQARLRLGTWQAVYLCEWRAQGSSRRLALHLLGSGPQPSAADPVRSNALTMTRRSGAKLNREVQARHDPEAWTREGGIDTDVDLMIDRLHDISGD
jgi:secondary thiamine-phosphate synthase enzyme